MRYVDELSQVASNEIAFKSEIDKIIIKLYESKSLSREVKLFVNNVKKYCEKKTMDFKDDETVVLPIDDYCMFIINKAFTYIKKQSDTNQEIFLSRYYRKDIPKYFKDKYNEDYINAIINQMNMPFLGEQRFYFEPLQNKDYLEYIKPQIAKLNLGIIKELIDIEPIIFIGENHYDPKSLLTDLGILTIMLNTYVKSSDTIYCLVNFLTYQCMDLLLNNILNEKDINNLCSMYRVSDKEGLNMIIGMVLAEYIIYGKENELLDDVLEMAKEKHSLEYKINETVKKIEESFKLNMK